MARDWRIFFPPWGSKSRIYDVQVPDVLVFDREEDEPARVLDEKGLGLVCVGKESGGPRV